SRSFRIKGSPPVKRIFWTPKLANFSAKRVISSKLNSSLLGKKTLSSPKTSLGIQYVHLKLHVSVTEIRKSLKGLPKCSLIGSICLVILFTPFKSLLDPQIHLIIRHQPNRLNDTLQFHRAKP